MPIFEWVNDGQDNSVRRVVVEFDLGFDEALSDMESVASFLDSMDWVGYEGLPGSEGLKLLSRQVWRAIESLRALEGKGN